jgi:cysteinyl-tRNA synthetase
MTIYLYNTLEKKKMEFIPLTPGKVGMYVCGPTVYAPPHIGNTRSIVVYDMLYRLLNHHYGQENVTYVRNITDVDDKIILAARREKIAISDVTSKFTKIFHKSIKALNCLPPTHEPKATSHIKKMITIIEHLLQNGYAYLSQNHVYFSIKKYGDYGRLAGRNIDDMIWGSRIDISEHKQHPGDFVLWKPMDAEDDETSVFESPWGKGRPGWHIECSAMSSKYLGDDFDIHGGGADLMFPHHANEMAQSCCYKIGSRFARYWVHNGFLTVAGEKMSKSLGNFITTDDLLAKGVNGEVIRFFFLSTHYRKPIDFTQKALEDAKKALDSFYRVLENYGSNEVINAGGIDPEIIEVLNDDLNVTEAITKLHLLAKQFHIETDKDIKRKLAAYLRAAGNILGILQEEPIRWFKSGAFVEEIDKQIQERARFKKEKNWAEADRIRSNLLAQGIVLEDKENGVTNWHKA